MMRTRTAVTLLFLGTRTIALATVFDVIVGRVYMHH